MKTDSRKLAILATHPIQYYSPVFQRLSQQPDLDVKVFYGWTGLTKESIDPGFQRAIKWDIPLLEGYQYEFLENKAREPGTHHFQGIDVPNVHQRISQWEPDVLAIYGWSYKAHWQAMRYLHGRIPILFRGDSNLLDECLGIKQLLRRLWLVWVYRHIDHALAVGTENERYYRRHGLSHSQISFAPHAVDNRRFADPALNSTAQELRRSLGIDDQQTLIGFVGKLEPKKSPRLLLDAFRQTNRNDQVLLMVGTGELESDLKSQSTDRMHFLGFKNQSELPAIYHAMDILVLPSQGPGETWGLVVNEVMAAGRAAIVSDAVGCGIDLVKPTTDWIFRRGNAEQLKAILTGLPDRLKLLAIGNDCQSHIDAWSLESQVQGWRSCLNKLCPINDTLCR